MNRHQITLKLRPVPKIYARVYRARGMKVPTAHSGHGPGALIPLSLRTLHKVWAETHGYYWLPCILCGREYGGHEIGDTIPDPTRGPGAGMCICPFCTTKRNASTRILKRGAA